MGNYPADWKWRTLGSCATVKARIGWQGLTTAEYLKDGDHYLVNGVNIENGQVNWQTCFMVDEKRYAQDKNIQLQNFDVLVSKDGTIGKVAYVENMPRTATLNSGVFVIRSVDAELSQEYLARVFLSTWFDDFIKKITAGSTIVHLYQKDIVQFSFQIPPLSEQKRIADVLSNADKLIANVEKRIAKKRAIKQGAMQELLTGKKRLSGFEGEWERKRLGDNATMFAGGTPSTNIAEYYGGGIPWVSISDISLAGKYISSTSSTLTELGLNNSSAKWYPPNTLLFAMYASIGKCCIAQAKTTSSQAILGICNLVDIDLEFLYYILTFRNLEFLTMGQTGTQSNLSKAIVESIVIETPTLAEQRAIANVLGDMDAEIANLERKLEKLKLMKQGMMQDLLTGKVRLK